MHFRPKAQNTKTALISWSLYDFANSSFSTIIQTFVFAAYFTQQIAPDVTIGSTIWGTAMGIGGLLVAITSPLLGAITDQRSRRKPILIVLAMMCILATGLLWFAEPNPDSLWPVILLVGVALISFELSGILYNAMLPELAPANKIGRWSGWGWGLGYVGGLLSLILAYLAFIAEDTSWFALDRENYEHVRASFVLVAVWFLIFSLPFFFFTPDRTTQVPPWKDAARQGVKQLIDSLKHIKQYSHLVRFFIARMVFIDGLATIFAFGGVYAAGTFRMNEQEILLFGIGLNVTAGIGAATFAFLDDYFGGKKIILFALTGLFISSTLILLVSSIFYFWIFGLMLGLFVGPVQASSRSYLSRLAPENLRNEMFGLLSFSGKATAFLGPLLVAWITYISDSQRVGMSIILVFFLIGFLLMLTVPSDK